jgi:hypothetical protein
MRLRIKGPVVLAVLLSLLLLIGGAMIFKVKYEDAKDQQAYDDFRLLDQDRADRAEMAMPMVKQYDALSAQHPSGCAEMDELARKIRVLFPEFGAPGTANLLVPVRTMKATLLHYMKLG